MKMNNQYKTEGELYALANILKQAGAEYSGGRLIHVQQEKGKKFELEAKQYEIQLTQLEEKKKRICEMREDGSYTKEEFLERKQEIENQIATAKISMAECKIDQFDIEGALALCR